MNKTGVQKFILTKIILWGAIYFSVVALIYHIRWFVPFLASGVSTVVPDGQTPLIWFLVQVGNNIIFLFVGYLLVKLFGKFNQTGFFDKECIVVLDKIIVSCIVLAILGVIKLGYSNYNNIQIKEVSEAGIIGKLHLLARFITNIIVVKEPQTMYFLLAAMLWTVKQFVNKALFVKAENEKFI
ncbi:MAG: hypothetical protein KF862_10075 [Chitinophagaceae bacterium]|nr:hypothetical protein [Chitinophagaceae bacterium]